MHELRPHIFKVKTIIFTRWIRKQTSYIEPNCIFYISITYKHHSHSKRRIFDNTNNVKHKNLQFIDLN